MKRLQPITILLLFTSCASFFPQNTTPGSPVIGWDSLKASIEYPELLRRAGAEGAAYVYGQIGSDGSIDTMTIYANFPQFEQSVRKALLATKWHTPKNMKWTLHLNIHFHIRGHTRMLIEIAPSEIKPIP